MGAGREPGDGRRRTDECSHALGSGVAALPRVHRRSGKRRRWNWTWRLGQPVWDAGLGISRFGHCPVWMQPWPGFPERDRAFSLVIGIGST